MWKKHWHTTRQWFSNLHAMFSMQFGCGGDSIGAKQLDQHWCPLARLMAHVWWILLLQESVYCTTQGRFYFPTCRNVPAKYVTSGQFYLFKCRQPALWVSSLWCSFLLSRPALIIATVTQMQGGDFFSEHGQAISDSWRQFEAVELKDESKHVHFVGHIVKTKSHVTCRSSSIVVAD